MYKTQRLTPLRYPGGKARFAPFIKSIYDNYSLHGNRYAEPYAGGAGVALDLLLSGFCEEIHINDFDPAIYSFWQALITDSDNFLKLVTDTEISIDEWYKQKAILSNPNSYSLLEVGFSAFFLNRTNRSGILKAGVIGGKKQNSNYKLDARFNKKALLNRMLSIIEKKDFIYVYNLDALNFLDRINSKFSQQDLLYLDPPYYVKGQGLYRNFYTHNDHINVRLKLNDLIANWLVSYDNCPEIKSIYHDLPSKEYSLGYSANKIKKGKEIVFFSDRIKKATKLIIE